MKKLILPILLLSSLFIFPTQVRAVCPVCTVAVAGGIGISRYLGIDDTVTGLWIGGFIISSALWFSDWLRKKHIHFKYQDLTSVLVFYLLVIVPLKLTGFMGHPANLLLGIDKILLGSFVGSLLFLISVQLDKFLRSKNNGKVYVYYQKVILPVLILSISSLLLVLVLK